MHNLAYGKLESYCHWIMLLIRRVACLSLLLSSTHTHTHTQVVLVLLLRNACRAMRMSSVSAACRRSRRGKWSLATVAGTHSNVSTIVWLSNRSDKTYKNNATAAIIYT